jgi:hypothetical protein
VTGKYHVDGDLPPLGPSGNAHSIYTELHSHLEPVVRLSQDHSVTATPAI